MKDYRKDILYIHEEIEDKLDFILDVDNISVKKYYNMLDNLDQNYINIEDIDNERIITLYNSEEEGLEYLNKLKELLFFIRKQTIELNLKKIKMLLRRKRKKEELIMILRLLKEWEEFYQENKKSFSKEEQEKIENYFESIKNIKDEKVVIKKSSIKDNIKLTTMIGITEVVNAYKLVIPKKDKEKITKEVKKIEREEKIDNDIKITKTPEFVYIVKARKVGISNEMNNHIKKNSEKTNKRQQKQEEIMDIEIVKKEEKKDINYVKESAEVIGAISLGATTIVALPTIIKTVAAVEALKVVTENKDDYKKREQEEDKEIVELIEDLETEDIDKKEEEILKENGLENNIKENKQEKTETLTKEERFKVLKMNFEYNEKSTTKTKVFRVKKEKKKKENKKINIKKKNPIKKFISKVGRVAFLLSVNIALANILQKEVSKTLITGKTKILK